MSTERYPTPSPAINSFRLVALRAVDNLDTYTQAAQDTDYLESFWHGRSRINERAAELAEALAADWLRTEAYYVASEPLVEIHDVFASLDDAVSDAERAARECGGVFIVLRAGEVVERARRELVRDPVAAMSEV